MRQHPFTCHECGIAVVDASKRFEERVEFRRDDRTKSCASFTLRKLCMVCKDAAIAARRGGEQMGMTL